MKGYLELLGLGSDPWTGTGSGALCNLGYGLESVLGSGIGTVIIVVTLSKHPVWNSGAFTG